MLCLMIRKNCLHTSLMVVRVAILTLDIAIIVNDLSKVIGVMGKVLQVCTIDDGKTVMNDLFPLLGEVVLC